MAQLIISKIEGDARVIRVTQHGATSIRPACFVADVNEFGGVIIVSTAAGVRSIAVAQRGLSPEEIVVNGTTYATAGEAVQALNAFVGNFKPAGGAAQQPYVYETEAEFEADKANIPVGATVIKLYEYPDNLAGFMVVPDYANMETVNRITAVGGSWTADRSGFVKIHGIGKEGTGTDSFRININEELVSINRTQAQDGTATAAKMLIHSEILPIAKGDVISIASAYNNSLGCYFIPPKFIKKELPVVVEKNGSYSLDEVRTADTWIDGKPIYRKTLYFPALSNMSEVTQDVSGLNVDMFITMNGMFYGNSTSINPIPFVDTSITGMVAILYRQTTKVIAIKNPNIDLSDRYAYVTLTYTKTTD